MKNTSVFVVFAGLWLAATPLLFDHEIHIGVAAANDILVGLALFVLALIRVLRPVGTASLSLAGAILGGWLMVAPFVLGYLNTMGATLSGVLTGLVVIMLAGVDWLVNRPGEPERSS